MVLIYLVLTNLTIFPCFVFIVLGNDYNHTFGDNGILENMLEACGILVLCGPWENGGFVARELPKIPNKPYSTYTSPPYTYKHVLLL